MESLRDIRNRIGSVQKTMKITNAMYLMASSKLKKARRILDETEPYFLTLQHAITRIIAHTELDNERFFATDRDIPSDEVRHCYVIITSDRGLAGAYNHNVCRLAEQRMRKHPKDLVICIGNFGKNYFSQPRDFDYTLDEAHCIHAGEPSLWEARALGDYLVKLFLEGELDAVHVVYTHMVNAFTLEARKIELLPLHEHMFSDAAPAKSNTYVESYDPSPSVVLQKIIPNYVKGILYGTMVEAYASEQRARMTAMDNATKNAREIVDALSLEYNRIRQANITTEITEVVSGAAAQE